MYGRGPNKKENGVQCIASNWEFLLHVLLARLTGWSGIYSFFATRKFLRELRRFKPDVVHLHELHGYYINIYRVINELKIMGVPTVWTFHCEFMYTGKCGYAMECEKWKTECHHCPQLREYPKSWTFDFTRAMFKQKKRAFKNFFNLAITSPSDWLSRRVRQSMLADKRVQTVFNGIDVDVFRPRDSSIIRKELNISESQKVILCVGSDLLSDRKGGQWALQLAQRWADKSIVLVMVGVEQSIPQHSNVRILPPIFDQRRLAEFYSLADVLLLTSEKETFSMVCAESLACGTAVIGFDSGAPKEIAPEGYGIFVPYGDIDALEHQVVVYLENTEMLENSEQCVLFARERYADTVMASNFENLYLKLLNGYAVQGVAAGSISLSKSA